MLRGELGPHAKCRQYKQGVHEPPTPAVGQPADTQSLGNSENESLQREAISLKDSLQLHVETTSACLVTPAGHAPTNVLAKTRMEFSFHSSVKEAQAFETGSSHIGGHENFLRAGQSQSTGQLRCLTLKDEKQREST